MLLNSKLVYLSSICIVSVLLNASGKSIAEESKPYPRNLLSLQQALELTRLKQPNIKLQQQLIHLAKGERQEESGVFDPNLSGSVARGQEKNGLFADESFLEFEFQLNKDFRSGQNVRLVTTLEHRELGRDVLLDAETSPDTDGIDEDDVSADVSSDEDLLSENRASVYLEMTQPLLRNRGKEAAGAQETAARITVQARQTELREKIAQSLLETSLAYWNYVSAKKTLDVRKQVADSFRKEVAGLHKAQDHEANQTEDEESEDETEDEDTEGEDEEAELFETGVAEAELFSRDTALVQAKQALFSTRQALGVAMGLTAYVDMSRLPEPNNAFARISASERKQIADFIPLYCEKVRQRRAAVQVLSQFEQSAKVRIQAAKRNLQPQLDLIARVGYSGNDRGKSAAESFSSFGSRTRGFNWIVGAQFSYPIGTNVAEGILAQEQAQLADFQIQRMDLLRTIDASITTLVNELLTSSVEIELTENSIKLFKRSVKRQRSDFHKNPQLSGLIDLIGVENDWIDARIDKIDQQLRHASAIANLAFETGAALDSGLNSRVRAENLTRIPNFTQAIQ